MQKIATLLLLGMAMLHYLNGQDYTTPNPEVERQELINLEKETARAIQQANGTFFRRVYADDFVGTLSHGQPVTKLGLIEAVEKSDFKFDSFAATDINVKSFRDTAVVTSLWSSRAHYHGEILVAQMRVMHVYLRTSRGWKAVAGQATALPPYKPHPM